MKNRYLTILILVALPLFTLTINSVAQRGYRASGAGNCCLNLPGLTEDQKSAIAQLEAQHLKEMEAMRNERQQSGNYATRDAWLSSVDQKVANHRSSVRALLNADQQAAFDQLQTRRGPANVQGRGRGAAGAGRSAGCPYYGRGFRGGR